MAKGTHSGQARTMAPQLNGTEVAKLQDMLKKKETPKRMLETLQRARPREGQEGPTKTTIYNWLAGGTHVLGEEARGRPPTFIHQCFVKAFGQRAQEVDQTS